MLVSELKLKISVYASVGMIMLGTFVPRAFADDAAVVDNGSGSTNQVTSTSTEQTAVTQSNSSNFTTTTTTNANTGNNTASNNTGENTAVVTGNATANTEVENNANVSVATVDSCCTENTSTNIISGNGTNSQNTVNSVNNSSTSVSVNQVANITNNSTTNANTGNNTADNNSGNVSIKTGNIFASTLLINAPVNISKIKVSEGLSVDSLLKIAGNGVSSLNIINSANVNNNNISYNNIANFINIVNQSLNTGGNSANNNNGDVKILTGDIWSEIKIKNLANISEVIVDCGCKPTEENPPIIPPGITTTPPSVGGGGNPSPSSSSGASAVASAIGGLLPSTGVNWLIIALIGNVLMMFLGTYLRLRSGRSPGFAITI